MKTDTITSWEKNASEWIKIIQNNSIPSRKYTNRAILDAVKELKGKKIVDIGCGEGWLTREMGKMGWEATGIDAIQSLITEARKKSSDSFYVGTYEDIMADKQIENQPFDAAIFNFCLYAKDDLPLLLGNTLKQITAKGSIVIQTLHPFFLVQNGFSYESQWLSDSWKGLPGDFKDGHVWYARTLEDWIREINTLQNVSFTIKEIRNDEGNPISLIIKITKL
ncbi:class I SAM-dependent methyltransferase [Flagellimonas nanhaiensis]|uniref:Class I SAM-dependent methyltransferase n=1 Tax=Flagellimonas nanhaiensis TaxID=2292706 RepID=A0A371JTD7_9FLAO|nr:class I SAM-dependent methyltransferase [Allomuricauda nanhaiensis]RDY61093.1 class I SAM-dependent methyltransferase [Allomuricauda nanhaiensis]